MAKILVAEDDVHVIRLMSIWLTKKGHEVLEASDGDQAKVILDQGGVECVVTDMNMPHCDGVELVRYIRNEVEMKIPIIMLSARCDQERLGEDLSNLDVSVYPKPFSPSRLSAEIEEKLSAFASG